MVASVAISVPEGVFRGASALKYIEPGPLGDASGKFSLVLAYVNVVLLTVFGVMCAPSY